MTDERYVSHKITIGTQSFRVRIPPEEREFYDRAAARPRKRIQAFKHSRIMSSLVARREGDLLLRGQQADVDSGRIAAERL